MNNQVCLERVTAAGRTVDARCAGPICTALDVLAWRSSAQAWTQAAAREARTEQQSNQVGNLQKRAWAYPPVGLPSAMVDYYVEVAQEASCLMQAGIETQAGQRPPEPAPQQPPFIEPPESDEPWSLPDLPDLPGLPGLPKWPTLPDPNWLLIALLIFGAGWLTGEVLE